MPERLKIAQIAPVGTAVRRRVGESVEQHVSLLCDGLTERGHEVTLFATADSQTSAELRSCFDHGYEHDPLLWDWQFTEYTHAGHAYAQADEFDVVHCHTYHFGLPFAAFVSTPNVHTHHVHVEPGVVAAYRRLEHVHLVALSRYHRAAYGGRAHVELIPHGVDTAAFPFGSRPQNYLLFLGRMIEDKGPAQAVQIARRTGMPLVLAGPPGDGFEERVAPLIDGGQITYTGRVEPDERDRLLAGAAALLYPLQYPEPFGLVPIEAMSCGTPVLAVGIGAVPELVEPGVTGYLAASWEALPRLVPAALELDRRAVRARAVQRFDAQRMVDRHEALYRRLAAQSRRRQGRADGAPGAGLARTATLAGTSVR